MQPMNIWKMKNELIVQQIAAVLVKFGDAAQDCRTENAQYRNVQNIEIDEEAHSHMLILETFYNLAGSNAIYSITNFELQSF